MTGVTSRPLAPSVGTNPSTLDADDLGLTLSRVQEATLGWGRPLDSYEPATSFDIDATEDWVLRHGLSLDGSSSPRAIAFIDPPFSHIPSRSEALWWLYWNRLGADGSGAAERSAEARATLLSPTPHDLPAPDGSVGALREFSAWIGPSKWDTRDPFIVTACEVSLFGAATLAEDLITEKEAKDRLLPARAMVMPQLDRASRQRWLSTARVVDPSNKLRQLALLGDAEQYAEEVMSLPVGTLEGHLYGFADLLAPLPDPATAAELFGRLKIRRNDHLSALWPGFVNRVPIALAAAGPQVLDRLVEVMVAERDPRDVTNYLQVLSARLHGPGAVPAMVRIARESRAPEMARAWLVDHPAALAATSASFSPTEATFLDSVIRETVAQCPDAFAGGVHNPTVAGLVSSLAKERGTVTLQPGEEPAWWRRNAALERRTPVPAAAEGGVPIPTTLPAYAEPAVLPGIVIDGATLNPAMVAALVWSAVNSANDPNLKPRPLVAAARQRMGDAMRDRIGLALFDGWMSSGAAPDESAIFVAAGYIGADGLVERLVPLVRGWTDYEQHPRAVLGFNVLIAAGTKAAWHGIYTIAHKTRWLSIREAARQTWAKMASARGLTVDQLADLVVPDGGLDQRGSRVFSYGSRSFQANLSPQGSLVIRDLDADGQLVGTIRTAPPAPTSTDDPELVAIANVDFRRLRKQLASVAAVQSARLEHAMVVGRTWAAPEHRERLANNPVLNWLIRPLIWEVIDRHGRTLVRVTAEREYLTVDDDVYEPSADGYISLAHPLYLSAGERSRWQQHLADYELIAPIEQLDRAVFRVPAGLAGFELPAPLLPQGRIHPDCLKHYGWRPGDRDATSTHYFCWLGFQEFDQAVAIEFEDGPWMDRISELHDQKVGKAFLMRPQDVADVSYLPEPPEGGLDWSKVVPRVYSEMQRSFAKLTEQMD